MLNLLIGPAVELATGYFNNKKEKAVAKQKLEVAKIEAQVSKVQQDGTWEEVAMKASDSSWKDEAWTILFIIIIAMCFIPFTQPYVERGFTALDGTPDWFQYAVYASIAASFGLRSLKGMKK